MWLADVFVDFGMSFLSREIHVWFTVATKIEDPDLKNLTVELKDFEERKFNYLVDNFHVLKSALRYYSVKKGVSFTSSKLSEDFPLAVTVAGSSLSILTELGIVEPRRRSNSPDRYLAEEVDLQRMNDLGTVLVENHEIKSFNPSQK